MKNIVLTFGDGIPYYDIDKDLGEVEATNGDPNLLRSQARRLGADAVVGIVEESSARGRLTGRAVTLKPKSS